MPLAEVSRACKLEPGFARLSGVLSNNKVVCRQSPVAIEISMSRFHRCARI